MSLAIVFGPNLFRYSDNRKLHDYFFAGGILLEKCFMFYVGEK